MTLPRPAAVFRVSAALSAAAFWFGYARSLQYDVYVSADVTTYLYSEDYSQGYRVALTLLVAFGAAALTTWLASKCRRGPSPAERVLSVCTAHAPANTPPHPAEPEPCRPAPPASVA